MRYQEALERVKDTIKDLRDLKYEPYITDEDIEILQEAIDEDDLKTLQELVDKAIPKEVKVCSFVNAKGKHIDEYYCGSCDHYIDRIKYEKHCFNCGQALDWSDK